MEIKAPSTQHATCVDIKGSGVLIVGDSGSGKSGLAIGLIALGASLVADDQCEILIENDILHYDIKGNNILLQENLKLPILIDFGLLGNLNFDNSSQLKFR